MVSIRSVLRLIFLLMLLGLAAAAATWTSIDFPSADETEALGINNHGDIVGFYTKSGLTHGFVLKDGTYTSVDVAGAIQTVAKGINDWGTVTGFYSTQFRDGIGFLFDGANFTDVDIPGYQVTVAFSIDNSGDVVGYYGNGGSNPDFHGFKWNNGTFRTIEVGFVGETIISGINNHGYMVGYDPWSYDSFVRKPGGTIEAIPFSNPCCGLVNGLNDSQALVGSYVGLNLSAFRVNAVTLKLIKLQYPGANVTYANGINDAGETVGTYMIGSVHHGFLQSR
jgi:uncharacterized membrane protein